MTMTATYDSFLENFKTNFKAVAEIDGEESSAMEVIFNSLDQAGLKDLCDSYDKIKNSDNTGKNETSQVEKKTKKTKKTEQITTQNESGTVDDKESKATKTKRITAYNVYVAEQVRVKKMSMKEAAASWKQLNQQDKEVYVERAKSANKE